MDRRMFDNQEIGLPCPQCGHKTAKTICWVKTNNTFACESCSAVVHIERDELLRGLRKFDKSVADFKRKFGEIGKRFKL
jgi:transcription elongation factor Elf1